MEEKQINKWLRRRFSGIGWILLGYLALLNLMVLLSMSLASLRQVALALKTGDYSLWIDSGAIQGDAWGYILTIAVGFVVLLGWKGWDYCREEILAKERPMTVGAFAGLVCLCMGAQFVNDLWIGLLETILNQFGHTVEPLLEMAAGTSETVSMFLYSTLLGPIAEEVLFRGLILRTLRPFGKRFAIVMSAVLFGMFHGNLLQAPCAMVIGLLFGYAAMEHSILWAVALHVFNNLVLAELLGRVTSVLPELLASGVILGIFGAAALIGAVLLLRRRREIGAYRQAGWMDIRCLKCFFTNSGIVIFLTCMAASMSSLLLY